MAFSQYDFQYYIVHLYCFASIKQMSMWKRQYFFYSASSFDQELKQCTVENMDNFAMCIVWKTCMKKQYQITIWIIYAHTQYLYIMRNIWGSISVPINRPALIN